MPLYKGAHAYVTENNKTCHYLMIGFWRLTWSLLRSPSIGVKMAFGALLLISDHPANLPR
jgi:hypothetical protein